MMMIYLLFKDLHYVSIIHFSAKKKYPVKYFWNFWNTEKTGELQKKALFDFELKKSNIFI